MDIIKYFYDRGYTMAPLKKGSKHPCIKKWNSTNLQTEEQVRNYKKRGFDLCVVLQADDLIIDIDPRNGGLEGIKDFCQFANFRNLKHLLKSFPSVRTGSNGYHIYCKKNPELKLKNTYPDLFGAGVEFKSKNRQVVAPESIHKDTGEPYKLIKTSPYHAQAPLFDHLSLQQLATSAEQSNEAKNTDTGTINTRELRQILKQIPVEEFRDYETWFSIMCSAHYSTGGKGAKTFASWCIKDTSYKHDYNSIIKQWSALKNNHNNLITEKSLISYLFDAGGELPESLKTPSAEPSNPFEDFAEEVAEKNELIESVLNKKEPKTSSTRFARVKRLISELSDDADLKELNPVLRQLARTSKDEQTFLIRDLSKKTSLTKTEINKILSISKRKKQQNLTVDDLALTLSSEVLDKNFKGGKHLIHAIDQQYWQFDKTHWIEKRKNVIDKTVLETCVNSRQMNHDLDFSIASLMIPVERILQARVASDVDLFNFEGEQKSIINLKNGELHINQKTGKTKLKPHNHESYLTTCLENVEFDPEATAPRFEQMCKDIFGKEKSPEEVAEHIYEIFGYALQPKKNIPCWFMFYGTGSNGKSTLLKIFSALAQGVVLEASIGDFDTGKNSHALESLPHKTVILDDDVKTNTILPDDFLKKISENKTLSVNPKFKRPFRFKAGATPILACNNFPKTQDVSDGMLRRAFIVPFNQRFKRGSSKGFDLDIAEYIIKNEISGVLDLFLKGLRNLRKRGYFDVPEVCAISKQEWQHGSNTTLAFVHECVDITKSKKDRISSKEMYEAYEEWCDAEEIEYKFRKTKRGFGSAVKSTGIKSIKGAGGVQQYTNVKFKEVGEE